MVKNKWENHLFSDEYRQTHPEPTRLNMLVINKRRIAVFPAPAQRHLTHPLNPGGRCEAQGAPEKRPQRHHFQPWACASGCLWPWKGFAADEILPERHGQDGIPPHATLSDPRN
jgi:hypothetical protein